MKKSSKLICFLLAVCMLLALLAACADNVQDDPQKKPDDPGTGDEPGKDTDTDYLLTLPKENYDTTFTVLCRTDKEYEIWTESPDGTMISSAVFNRNARVGEYCGVEILSYPVDGNWDQQSTFISTLKAATGSGDDAYQLVAGYMAYITELAADGNFYNLNSVETLDFSKPWYSQSFIENCDIGGKLYFAQGDLSLTMWEGLYAVFFNKEMAEANNITGLYDLVRDHEWTLEEFEMLSASVFEDNGDEVADENDVYGLITNRHSLRTLITTCDVPIVERKDDEYDLVYYSKKVQMLYDEMFSFLYNQTGVFFSQPKVDADYTEMLGMFQNNQGLFMTGTLDNASTLRGMETDFGILPFPLYDVDQEDYLSHSYDGQSVFSIPSSAADPEMAGRVMDALGAENCHSVIPTYYEVMLMDRVTRDDESREMLNTIRKNLFYDFGFIYAVPLGGLFQLFGDQLQSRSAGFASYYNSQEGSYLSKLETLLENYDKLAD